MKVLVDTSVWSEFFRRKSPNTRVTSILERLVDSGSAEIIGPIRQEILSGIASRSQYEKLRKAIRAFPDEAIQVGDYEAAADMFNRCRAKGVQGSNTDFLICAIAERLQMPIFTLDRDFERFAEVLAIQVLGENWLPAMDSNHD